MASREETVLRAETSCSRAGAPQSQLQFLADWRELSVTAPVRSHSMFTVMELLAWNSLLRVGAYRSPNGLWMTAFSCDFNRWMQHLLSEYREEDVVDEVPEEDLLHRSGQGTGTGKRRP